MSHTQLAGWTEFLPVGQEVVPQKIKYADGAITTLSQTLVRSIRHFCATNNTNDLPVSRKLWTGGTDAEAAKSGNGRTWRLRTTNEEIRVGRFRYGKDRQFLVAQGKPESNWESGGMVLIGGSSGSEFFTIWRFQSVWEAKDEDADRVVECVFSPEDRNQQPTRFDFSSPIFARAPGSPFAVALPAPANRTNTNSLPAPQSRRLFGSRSEQSEILKRKTEEYDADARTPKRRRGQPSSRPEQGNNRGDDDSEYSPIEKTPKPRKKNSYTLPPAPTPQKNEGSMSAATKQEARSAQSITTWDLLKVKVVFLSSTGAIVRERFLDRCIPLDQLFLQAYAANIIEEHGSKLTAYIGNDEYTLVKTSERDYEDLLAELENTRATELGIRRGMEGVL
jgi:hypothetical protein